MAGITATDGTRLHSRVWGEGPDIVLVHGWPLDADMWEYQAVPLAEAGFRVIAYDRRGFGRSGQPWSGYDYDTLADDLNAVMDGHRVRDATLVGFSMGGCEAARYMTRHGSGVARLALVAAVTPFLLKTADNPDGVDGAVFDRMIEGLRADRAHFLAGFGKAFFGAGLLASPVSTEILAWSLAMAMQGSPRATIECVRSFSATDFRADLAVIRVPTLVIHGDADETVPLPNSGARTAQMVPGAELRVYKGAPHGLQITEKDRLTADLAAFARGR